MYICHEDHYEIHSGHYDKKIYRNPTTSMTNNPPSECSSSKHWVLSYEQRIIALSKVHKVNKASVLGHKNVVFFLVATAHLQP
jgi:hypothetical protein